MLSLFRTTAETMNDQMCSILDQYRSPFVELINTRIHQVYLESQGGYSGFQVMGMIEWSQKSRPKKIPRASSKTQKNPWTKNADYCITRAM